MRYITDCDKEKGVFQAMIRCKLTKTWNVVVAATMALAILAAALVLPISPVYAHAPQGAGEAPEVVLEPIQIYDQEGNLLEISIDELAEIEGNLCVCISTGFRVIQTAIEHLYGEDEIPSQGEFAAIYRHPGKGHKTAFTYILTEEYATYEKTGNPQKMTMDNWVYTLTRLDTGEEFETQVQEGVISEGFFDLRYKVNGFKNGWHDNEPTEKEKAAFVAKWTETRDNFLTMPAWELYSGVEEPKEPAPVAAIAFSSVLIVLIGAGFVYSTRGKRR
jgi:hypothetical protein